MSLGLFVSAFATTEFQAVQFMPALVFPQLLLCGLFVARADMAEWLQVISAVLPLTYAYDALAKVAAGGPYGARFVVDVAVTVGATLLLPRARRGDAEASDGLARYSVLTAAIRLSTESFASPKSITVCGSR